MSDEKVIQEVRDTLRRVQGDCGCIACEPKVASALDRAGLLVTDLHRRALRACETYALQYESYQRDPEARFSGAPIIDIGRESLATKEAAKPKPRRWSARPVGHNETWILWDEQLRTLQWTGFTEAQARAVEKVLNELEAAK